MGYLKKDGTNTARALVAANSTRTLVSLVMMLTGNTASPRSVEAQISRIRAEEAGKHGDQEKQG